MWSWLTTNATMPAAPSIRTGTISFHDNPAKKITNRPADRIRIAVPRSGCLTTKPTGIKSNSIAMMKSGACRRPSRFWNHHASIIGIPIFRISLGWITTPTLSQRVAPFLVTPNTAVATSSATPNTYNGTARPISFCGGICATMNMMAKASAMLRP